jgi:hypothetical protein
MAVVIYVRNQTSNRPEPWGTLLAVSETTDAETDPDRPVASDAIEVRGETTMAEIENAIADSHKLMAGKTPADPLGPSRWYVDFLRQPFNNTLPDGVPPEPSTVNADRVMTWAMILHLLRSSTTER